MTEKQKRFVDEYLIDLNATQAAIRAGYSSRTAEAAAARMLRNVNVQRYMQERQADRQARTEVKQDQVVQELAAIAFSDIADFARVRDGDIDLENTISIPRTKRGAIAGIKKGSGGGVEVKLNDKVKALELLGRHLGMFNDRVQVTGAVTVEDARARLLEKLARARESKSISNTDD